MTQSGPVDSRSLKQNANANASDRSDVTQSASIQGNREPVAAKISSQPPAGSSETLPGKAAAPPVQGFE